MPGAAANNAANNILRGFFLYPSGPLTWPCFGLRLRPGHFASTTSPSRCLSLHQKLASHSCFFFASGCVPRALLVLLRAQKKTVKKTCLASFYILNLSFLLPPHRFHTIVGSIKTYRHATKVTIMGPGKGISAEPNVLLEGTFCQKLEKNFA